MSADGGELQEFPNATKNKVPLAIHDLRWLPDSSGISLSDMIPEGKEQTLYHLDLKTGEWIKWPIPVKSWTRTEWSKDGKSFLYVCQGSVNNKKSGIIERNPMTEAEHYVYDKQQGAGLMRSLRFSWDYTKLFFTETVTGLKMIDMKTGEFRLVSSEFNGSLTISPDAKHLLVSGERSQLGFPTALLLLSVADGSARKLDLGFPEGTALFNPSWSPDGKRIAFMAQSQILELFFMKNIIPK
jgi:dipeptidyl aminopeptidase/acylaminoacyl peptidase